ncbi:MAG: 4-hydroxyphenylpyruvate dioxygenase [Anaerolineae bacterium]|nr:4-hydroxyphenylpyruvate dioxygenase [Phycisphaerae bacterium]
MTVANLTKDPIAKKPGENDNPLGLKGVDHIEFLVDNADEWSAYHESKLGMYRRAYGDPSTGLKGRKAFVVGQGRVNFLFAEPAGSGPEADAIRAHIAKHGNGVKDVAFRVKDVAASLAAASKAGAKVVRSLDSKDGFTGGSIAAYGDTIHTFISRTNHAQFAPNYVNMPGGVEEGEIQFMMIDHIVANVEHMNDWVEYYHRVFGFDETRHFDINTGKSALMSKVVGPTEGYVKLPINEPSSENSQIQEFLNEYKGPGVQHIALLTNDIIQTVGEMRNRGMNFLDVPDTYYELMPGRVGEIKENIEPLKKLRILVDRDRADGYLLQLFSQPIFDRPTLFYEVIQRRGNSDGFGEGNFTALFEAIEREQAKRGTL